MPYQESETVELKSVIVDDIKTEERCILVLKMTVKLWVWMPRTARRCRSATWSGIPPSRISLCSFWHYCLDAGRQFEEDNSGTQK